MTEVKLLPLAKLASHHLLFSHQIPNGEVLPAKPDHAVLLAWTRIIGKRLSLLALKNVTKFCCGIKRGQRIGGVDRN